MSPWKPLADLQDIVSFQAKEVEETVEGLLLRLEEFCSLADMVSACLGGVGGGPGQTAGPSWASLGSHLGGGLASRRRGQRPAVGEAHTLALSPHKAP